MTAGERSLQKLAGYLGLDARAISEPPAATSQDGCIHIAATCRSLQAFRRHPRGQAWLSDRLAVPGSSLFVTGIGGSPRDVQIIDDVLPGVVEAVRPVTPPGKYHVHACQADGMRYLSGLTFGPAETADRTFRLRTSTTDVQELIAIDGAPCYVRVDREGASYFLVACTEVLDVDAAVPRGVQSIDRFLRFVPFLAYLRRTFGACCWTNDNPAACLIIDDPLLRERYGFLDFRRLDSRLDGSPFSMNIAFIPWNYRRTDRRTAERFKRPDRRFSISIHGCDHSEAEFESTDERWLRRQARRALARMEAHQRLTGIAHNRVMVFPQGVFSKASLRALGDEGFVAAVNSTIYPVDAAAGEITFSDFLAPAVTKFGGAPLFMRHYPERLHKVALDLFLGRPALIVEHHGFFKNGYEDVARCVDFVNHIAPGIQWTDLEDVCASVCLKRETGDHTHLRTFGSTLRIRNPHGQSRHFTIARGCVDGELQSVTWNDRAITFDVDRTGATCHIVLDAAEEGVLHFRRQLNGAPLEETRPSLKDRFKVFARRRLCELRDNYLDRNPVLSELARAGRNLLPRG